jgi:hypothetical protein
MQVANENEENKKITSVLKKSLMDTGWLGNERPNSLHMVK